MDGVDDAGVPKVWLAAIIEYFQRLLVDIKI